MSSTFPTTLTGAKIDFDGSTAVSSVEQNAQGEDINAIAAKVGYASSGNSPVANAVLCGTGTGTSEWRNYVSLTVADNSGDHVGLTVTQNDTTNNPIGVTITNAGTNSALNINQTGVGRAAYFYSNTVQITNSFVRMQLDNASSDQKVLEIINDGTGNGLFIDQNGNGVSLNIDSEATTSNVVYISGVNTNGSMLVVVNEGIQVGNSMIAFIQEHASSSERLLEVRNDGSGNGIWLDQNGNGDAINIDTEATTQRGLNIEADAMTAGALIRATTACATFTGDVFKPSITNAGASGKVVSILNAGTGNGLFIDQNSSGIALNIDQDYNTSGTFGPAIAISTTNAAGSTYAFSFAGDCFSGTGGAGSVNRHLLITIDGVAYKIPCTAVAA